MSRYRIIEALEIQMMKMIMLRKIRRIKTTSTPTQVKEGNAINMKRRSELMMTYRKKNNMMMITMTKRQVSLRMRQSTTSQASYHRLHSSHHKKTPTTLSCQGCSILTFHSKNYEKCT